MFLHKIHQNRTIKNYFFEEREKSSREGTPILNFTIIYYWDTYENVELQISAKSHHK